MCHRLLHGACSCTDLPMPSQLLHMRDKLRTRLVKQPLRASHQALQPLACLRQAATLSPTPWLCLATACCREPCQGGLETG